MHEVLEVPSQIRNYSVTFTKRVEELLQALPTNNVIRVVDEQVAALHPTVVDRDTIVITSTEDVKTMEGAEQLMVQLRQVNANIHTTLVAIGGGIIQDLAGFCASIYCRGIDYVLVPTTLLAQADSCVGGKTSINVGSIKNLAGTFYPPTSIYICEEFLATLPSIDMLNGHGELFKFAVLRDKIQDFSYNTQDLLSKIQQGLQYKIDTLGRDEFDRGERRFLNYGHTFGHALESLSDHKITHGVGVIIGCMIATKVALALGADPQRHRNVLALGAELARMSGVVFEQSWFDSRELILRAKMDKKSTGEVTMVLIFDKPLLQVIENESILQEAIQQVYESIRLRY